MCCCIPLRRLSYLGAISHMLLGILYLYYCGSVSYTLYTTRDQPLAKTRLVMGLCYIAYFAAFLPPSGLILWGVHKKLRRFLVAPSVAFMIIQIYGIGIESYFGYKPQILAEGIKLFNRAEPEQMLKLKKLKGGLWLDVAIQAATTIVYLLMMYFYYREIGPESAPAHSRYAQAYHQQQQHVQVQQAHGHSQPLITHNLSHINLGPQPPVPFRPVNVISGTPQPPVLPISLSLGGQNAGGQLPCRNTTPLPSQGPPLGSFNLAALSNLTYEQQQQLLKLQQHPLILQQQQHLHQLHHHQQQQGMDPNQHPLVQHSFQSYAQLLDALKDCRR